MRGRPTERMTQHTLRVPDDVWAEAMRITEERQETISDVLRDALVAYCQQHRGRKRRAS